MNENSYSHLTVNYSVNFVDLHTGTHTKNVERMWLEVRKLVPRFGRKKTHYEGYLSECLFIMRQGSQDKVPCLLEVGRRIVPGATA
ncbi:hypothetical protein NQ314_002097 [Rhamnusium bicolor]|uniref:ISXO2-like transposase domain-containing protein n=1 Tax=Rhamnusium bicolor TaxID=1586634 RepID=A0AAV8ZSM9_9CUCU|nr:hypothetical protein NQ314_002097 [Rhamnusium bicolor]